MTKEDFSFILPIKYYNIGITVLEFMKKTLNLLKYNRHWNRGFAYPFAKKRKLFAKLISFVEKKQIIEITGLRRVGKTTLFFQLINHLLVKKANPFRILYFTFDEEKPTLDSLFKNFTQQAGIDYKKEKIFVFLDEIQKLDDFQNKIKIYHDLYPNLKFFLSGSSSLFLKKKKQESLAGRVFSFFLPPLDFEEYLLFKEKSEILKKPLLFKDEIEREFEIFIHSQFIESINLKLPEEKKEYFISIVKKIIFEDIPAVFPVENPQILWQIVKIIAQKPGMLVNYQNLASDLGISNKTVSLYLYFLEEAFLIKKVYNFSRNLLTSEKKLKKYYLASPSFSTALADFQEMGLLVENLVLSLKNIHFFWRDAYKHEVDFVEIEKGEKIVPLEVKYKETVLERDLKNIFLFLKKFKIKKGIVLSREEKERRVVKDGKVISIKPIFEL